VVLHLVGPRELLGADRTGEDLALVAFVVEEGVPLEAVLVLEGLLYVDLGALGALVDALGYRGVAKQIEPAHRHLRQLLGRVLGLGGGPATHAPLWDLATRGGAHRTRLTGALTRRCRRRLRRRRRLLLEARGPGQGGGATRGRYGCRGRPSAAPAPAVRRRIAGGGGIVGGSVRGGQTSGRLLGPRGRLLRASVSPVLLRRFRLDAAAIAAAVAAAAAAVVVVVVAAAAAAVAAAASAPTSARTAAAAGRRCLRVICKWPKADGALVSLNGSSEGSRLLRRCWRRLGGRV
jgi:hypothetical protein